MKHVIWKLFTIINNVIIGHLGPETNKYFDFLHK